MVFSRINMDGEGKLTQKLDLVLEKLSKQEKDIARINRGLYGDPDNETPGLIARQKMDEDRLQKLEESNKRQKYWLAGVVVGIQGAWFFITKFLTK